MRQAGSNHDLTDCESPSSPNLDLTTCVVGYFRSGDRHEGAGGQICGQIVDNATGAAAAALEVPRPDSMPYRA